MTIDAECGRVARRSDEEAPPQKIRKTDEAPDADNASNIDDACDAGDANDASEEVPQVIDTGLQLSRWTRDPFAVAARRDPNRPKPRFLDDGGLNTELPLTVALKNVSERNLITAPLLRFPLEVRLMIFRFALGEKHIRISYGVHYKLGPNKRKQWINGGRDGRAGMRGDDGGLHKNACICGKGYSIALLLVCRQIHAEARLLPYQINTFLVRAQPELLDDAFLDQLNDGQKEALRSIVLKPSEAHDSLIDEHEETWEENLRAIKDLEGLKYVHVQLYVHDKFGLNKMQLPAAPGWKFIPIQKSDLKGRDSLWKLRDCARKEECLTLRPVEGLRPMPAASYREIIGRNGW